jgi:uncharacterized membrane protein YkoI
LEAGPEPAVKASFIAGSASRADNRGVNKPRHAQRRRARLRAGAGAVVALAALLAALPAPATDGRRAEPHDHERARAAVQAGAVLPLATLLQRLQRSHPGQVLEVELEQEHGRWIYELKLLQPGGRLLKLELDASTGAVLQTRARDTAPAPKSP